MAKDDLGFKLIEHASALADKPAAIFEGKQITYKQLNENAAKLANALLAMGLKPKQHVSVIMENGLEYVEVMCGLIKAGMVHVPINWRLQPNELQFVLDNSDSSAVIVSEKYVANVLPIMKDLPKIAAGNYLMVGDKAPAGIKKYSDELAKASSAEPGIENNPEDTYFIGYTSGTTGKPKGAVTKHSVWPMKVGAMAGMLRLTAGKDEVHLLTMPMMHMNAINMLGCALYLGQTSVIMPRFDAENCLDLIQTYKCSWSSMVPTMYHRLKNLPEAVTSKYDRSSVKSLLTSSAPISFANKKWIIEFFTTAGLFEGYGGTEAGQVAVMPPEFQLVKPGSVGKVVTQVTQVKIIDEEGKEVATGQTGQVITRPVAAAGSAAPAIFEYYNDPEATAKNFKDGWFYSGDVGKVDEDGFLYLVDRVFDMIISGGENIYPQEVEEVLSAHPAVFEAAAVGVPDEEWGESVKAVVILKENAKATAEELIEYSKGFLAKFKVPKSVDFVDELPKTQTGKTIRRLVKEPYWAGRERRI